MGQRPKAAVRAPRALFRRWAPMSAGAILASMLLATVVLPTASGAVSVREVDVPDRTAADKPFRVSVRLANDGPERDVHLFGALYADEDGKAPCGPATDPSFRTFTHVAQVTVRLPAGSETTYPPPGDAWLHRYGSQHAGVSPRVEELCVFVAEASGGPVIEYEAYGTAPLSVRARNAPPQPSFDVEPASPIVSVPAGFRAEAEDADGDPVTFTWDFGRFDAGGRATAEGAEATHAFYPAGDYVVTLSASDGIDSVPLARTVTVVAPTSAEHDDARGIAAAPWAAAGAVALAAALTSRRRA